MTEEALLTWLLERMGSSRAAAVVPRVVLMSSVEQPPAAQHCFGTVYGLDTDIVLFVPCRGSMETGCRLRPGLVTLHGGPDGAKSPDCFNCFALRDYELQWFVKPSVTKEFYTLETRNQGSPRTDGGREQELSRFPPEQWKLLVEHIAPLLVADASSPAKTHAKSKKSDEGVKKRIPDLNPSKKRARKRRSLDVRITQTKKLNLGKK
ncbi:hypothetical protein KBB27_01170 [Patescibacteria group bacterium]|nr:hypothetical protein [Patescibacteria group bacterium]